jgi:hypothetical protein
MHSSLIGKIEKAKRYAQEPDRVSITALTARFRGENSYHTVSFDGHRWSCDCHFFQGWDTCSHVMAMEKLLGPMLPVQEEASSGL